MDHDRIVAWSFGIFFMALGLGYAAFIVLVAVSML
jgi:hypothetical protein